MRTLGFGLVLLGTALGLALACGESADGTTAAGGAGMATAGSSAGASAGKAGETATAGSASGGSANGGKASGGSAAGGADAGASSTGGQPDAQAGAGNEGGTPAGLVNCDPTKLTCKRAAPVCAAGEVPSVDDVGNCYGDCVKIAVCACSTAAQCPDPNQYTCWAKQHCGPFVK